MARASAMNADACVITVSYPRIIRECGERDRDGYPLFGRTIQAWNTWRRTPASGTAPTAGRLRAYRATPGRTLRVGDLVALVDDLSPEG